MSNILKQKIDYLLKHRDKNVIGQRLQKQRKKNNYTQEEAANSIGIQRETLRQYESGRVMPPRDKIEKLALLYGCDPSWLYGWNEIPLITTMTSVIMKSFLFSLNPKEIINAPSNIFLVKNKSWEILSDYLKTHSSDDTENLLETLSEKEREDFEMYKTMNYLLLLKADKILPTEQEAIDKCLFGIFYVHKILKKKNYE